MSQFNIQQKFPTMTPVKNPPPLIRWNGCGVSVYGKRNLDPETQTYIKTWCISLLFIPCFCLRAYRVANAPKGWYFLGREPLSSLAKGWNVLVIAAIMATIGATQYNSYTSSPGYIARQQMATAHTQVDQGHLAQAAQIYQGLATSGGPEADNAATAIHDLINGPCSTAALGESVGVFTAAAAVAHQGHSITLSELAEKGLKLVADKGGTEPRAGVAMLDVIRPLVIDTRPVDASRLDLLQKWAAAEPTNLDVIIPLASTLAQSGKLADAKKLLWPVKDQLGDGEGARVLGSILQREGDYEGAYTQLWPYVKVRLDRMHNVEKAADETIHNLWDNEVKLLENNKGPADFYDRYNAASSNKDQQAAMVRDYVGNRIKNDPQYIGTQKALERETAVVPVALELGMVMLTRAQGQTNPDVRKKQLESTEQVFLAISGVAGQTDAYRLSLGQIYYWLGKQAEGQKLFDDFLAANGRAFNDLLEVAGRMRQLGTESAARALSEEAYAKATKPEEQHEAAMLCYLCAKDLDDQITWLNKSDTADRSVKASLAKAMGEKAFQDGHDDEAVRQYRIAIDTYGDMPRSATTINETALAYYSIFNATGDKQSLERCIDNFQQAVDLSPSDSILLFNAGITLLNGAVADVIGNDIDLHALHQSGNASLLGYLYSNQAGRDAVVERVKTHPGIARAMSFLEKVLVLSPKNTQAYICVYSIHHFTHNDAALVALEQRIKAADLDNTDALAQFKEFLAGSKDQEDVAGILTGIKRIDAMVNTLRTNGGRTEAVAMDLEATGMLTQDRFGVAVDADKIVNLAEEAHRVAPSSNTNTTLVAALLLRASKTLRHTDAAFDAFCVKYGRSVDIYDLMAVAASEPSTFQKGLLQVPDFLAAATLIKESDKAFTQGAAPNEWALLKNVDADYADHIADTIRNLQRDLVEQSITSMLAPSDPAQALDAYWFMQIAGKPGQARDSIRKLAGMGIPLPIEP